MELDLRHLTKIARRWWWLLLLAPIIAGASAFFVSNRQTPLYSATAVLRVNPPVNSELNQQSFTVTTNLGETYRQLITYDPVLQRVVDKLKLPYGTDTLRANVTASVVRDTQLIKIAVSNPDPDQAALLANTIADQFIAYQAENTQTQIQTTLADINTQLSDVQTQLASVETELNTINVPANANKSDVQTRINELRVQQVQLQSRLDSLQSQSNSIASSVASGQVQVSVSNPAQPPSAPYAPRTLFYTALGVFVGLLIAVGAVALLEYLDNTVKADTDFPALTGVSLMSSIPTLPRLKEGANQVYTMTEPGSTAAEAVRLLRTNLEFAAAVAPIKSLAVTSTSPSEGKSTITANLGVAMAQAGFKTVIVDCDLRRPTQHKIFGVANGRGLSTLLTHPEEDWEAHAHRVALPGLVLVPSGPVPPNPADLLAVDAFDQLLERITADADIVLLDTPPILAVSDALIASRKTDGVLLLCRSGSTKREALQTGATALHQGDIRLVGVVLNQRAENETGGYYYYYDYTSSAPESSAATSN
ncbi:MAG: polysaccharide biosynthesis tyrosine autokinase [Thermomicrobiales bacterium]